MVHANVANVKVREKFGVQSKEPIPKPECLVSGGMMLALYPGKWLGVAPLSFSRRGGECRASFCRRSYIAGCLFAVTTCSLSLCGLVTELTGDQSATIRVKGGMTTVVWVVELMIFMLITIIGSFGARSRIRKVLQILIEKEKLDKQLSSLVVIKPTETSFLMPVASSMLFVLTLMSVDFYYISDGSGNYRTIQKFYYLFFFIKYTTSVILLTQFALLALAARALLRVFNAALEQQLKILEECVGIEREIQIKDLSKYNKIVDSLSYLTKVPEISSERLQAISRTCRELFRLHGRVMELPQAVNTTYGVLVAMLLMMLLLHLVETPYYIITDSCGTSFTLRFRCLYNISIQLSWLMYHFASLITIVEPCHWTIEEVSRTSIIVTKMLRAAGSFTYISQELMLFISVLSVFRFRYSPMGMCELTRPLLVSIMGAVTTYLVILVQFQTINEQITS